MNSHFWNQDKRMAWIAWGIVLLLVVPFLAIIFLSGDSTPTNKISYSSFVQEVAAGNVSKIIISGEKIEGEFNEPIQLPSNAGEPAMVSSFLTYLPPFNDERLPALLQENNVVVDTLPVENFSWFQTLLNLLPFALLIGLAILFFRNSQGGGQELMSVGKSRARQYTPGTQRVSFEDVAGNHGAKGELEEIIRFLKDPARFIQMGAKIPKGVLLVGPPGTGKTLLARAVAGEAHVPFFSISGSDFMEVFVGVGASRVRGLFQQAKESAPAIIFIDELDSIGRRRGVGVGGGHDEREQTLNQLLSEMDGFEPNENVIVMAATNRPDVLDPALQRPGRFDRQVVVDLPTLKDRLEILKIHAANKPLSASVNLEQIARGTVGFSGADLANLLNEAALLAARREKKAIDNDDLYEAQDKVILGLERNMVLTADEQRLLAYHEAGHAALAVILPHADPVHKVTIIPRGRAMGVTQQLPERERFLFAKEYMLDRITVMMGGRAAEELTTQTLTSGAADDLKQATRLARRMVLEWGMSERLGHISLADDNGDSYLGDEVIRNREYSETTAREIDEEVRGILEDAYARARQLLEEHRAGLDRLVVVLLEKEQVLGAEVMKLLDLPDTDWKGQQVSGPVEHSPGAAAAGD